MVANMRAAGRLGKSLRILALAMVCFLLLGARALAGNGDVLVDDAADLFTFAQAEQMRDQARYMAEKYDINVLLLTTDNAGGLSSSAYAERFYEDEGYYGNGADGGIILLIDLDNRELNLVTSGTAIRYITDAREEAVYDAGYGYAAQERYGNAMLAMLQCVWDFMDSGIPSGQYNYDTETGRISRYRTVTLLEALVAFLAALVCALFAARTLKHSYGEVKPYEYSVGQNVDFALTGQKDELVNQFTTRRIRPRVYHSSGGGGGHTGSTRRSSTHRSSGGHSYGGGHGRKF